MKGECNDCSWKWKEKKSKGGLAEIVGKQNQEEDFGFERKLPQTEGKRERESEQVRRGELARERVHIWRHVSIIWKQFFSSSHLMVITLFL